MGSLFKGRGAGSQLTGQKIEERGSAKLLSFPASKAQSEFKFPDAEFGLQFEETSGLLDVAVFGEHVLIVTFQGVCAVPLGTPPKTDTVSFYPYETRQGLMIVAALDHDKFLLLNHDSRVRKLLLFDGAEGSFWELAGNFDEEFCCSSPMVKLRGADQTFGWKTSWNPSRYGSERINICHLLNLTKKSVTECEFSVIRSLTPVVQTYSHLDVCIGPRITFIRNQVTGVQESRIEKLVLPWRAEPKWTNSVLGPNASIYVEVFPNNSLRVAIWRSKRRPLSETQKLEATVDELKRLARRDP